MRMICEAEGSVLRGWRGAWSLEHGIVQSRHAGHAGQLTCQLYLSVVELENLQADASNWTKRGWAGGGWRGNVQNIGITRH